MEKRKRKTERTHRALELATHEVLEEAEQVGGEKAVKDFIVAKTAERAAPRTLRDYETHFRYLRTWLDDRYPKISLNKITPVILREYVTWMSNEKEQWDAHPQRRSKKGISELSPMTVMFESEL